MGELTINNNKIELPKGTAIKYTKQISDIFDLAVVSCSYTNSFEFEKTPANTQTMQFLGISGDSSQMPYIKNEATLKVHGFDLISKGWYNVASTENNYKGGIVDGMIDFFKAIQNRTLGKDLDLSNFNHEKTLDTVVDSFTNDYYQYIIADYGGKTLFEDGINIDYLTPCFSIKKLWELIFSTFGFNCDYTYLDYLDGLYITYPKDVSEGQSDELIATLNKGLYITNRRTTIAGIPEPTYNYFWDSDIIIEGNLIDNWKYVIPESTTYNFNLKIAMYAEYKFFVHSSSIYFDVYVYILKNGIIIGTLIGGELPGDQVGLDREVIFNHACDKGDIIEVRIQSAQYVSNMAYRFYLWHHHHTDFLISKTDLGTTSLQNEFKDFLITDFIKEQIWRTGLTPVYNKETNTVNFIPLSNRVDFSFAQDYSHCFIERKGEIYQNDYAQKNIFKLKNNVDTDTSGDGYLYMYNKNLEDQKILVQSKIYAPDKKIVTNFLGFSTNQYKIWEAEPKDNNGVVEISYKGLSGRFYFIRKNIITDSFKLISEKLQDETVVSSIPIGINTNTLFEEAIFNYYSEYQKIFTNFRIHNIQLNVTEVDFLGLDLTRPVYFKQENAYYVCNKVDFQEGQFSSGEFIKINK